jgi:choline dehydrogenase-like flavoprotein
MSRPASDLKQPDDVVIVGGGSAGATLAARLSAAAPYSAANTRQPRT